MNGTVGRILEVEKCRTSYKIILVPIQFLVVPGTSKGRNFQKEAYLAVNDFNEVVPHSFFLWYELVRPSTSTNSY